MNQHYVVIFSTGREIVVCALNEQDAADRARNCMRIRLGGGRRLGRIVHLHQIERVQS